MQPVLGAPTSRQVAFVGPFGVGKTTGVCAVSDTPVTTTEVLSTALRARTGRHLKTTTTVGLEIGEWRTPHGHQVAVVGTPGQERFDIVRRTAMPRSTGVVLWLYGQHDLATLDAELWMEFISREVPTRKMTVAVTRLPEGGTERELERFRRIIRRFDPSVPVIAADPRERVDVESVLLTALRIPAQRSQEVVG
ncbi:MAG: hypothetical protein QM714_11545 [Nocardioides sp.]|uniref:hypothetical protein n=1 Tax=Nocardioides sp. TaxID=35761 RepID=UPI0039E63B42